jgi:hypothetical protein
VKDIESKSLLALLMSVYVYYSDKGAEENPVFWCKVKTLWSTAIVKVTHTFEEKAVPSGYSSLRLIYQGEFVSYATRQEYEDYIGGKPILSESVSKPTVSSYPTYYQPSYTYQPTYTYPTYTNWGGMGVSAPSAPKKVEPTCTCPSHCAIHCPNCGTLAKAKKDVPVTTSKPQPYTSPYVPAKPITWTPYVPAKSITWTSPMQFIANPLPSVWKPGPDGKIYKPYVPYGTYGMENQEDGIILNKKALDNGLGVFKWKPQNTSTIDSTIKNLTYGYQSVKKNQKESPSPKLKIKMSPEFLKLYADYVSKMPVPSSLNVTIDLDFKMWKKGNQWGFSPKIKSIELPNNYDFDGDEVLDIKEKPSLDPLEFFIISGSPKHVNVKSSMALMPSVNWKGFDELD